jgi:hypothetical protein
MPRISDDILDCSIYLYPSKDDALRGQKAGGSGFFISVKSEVRGYYLYAVTNSHVVKEGNSPVIRLNTVQGDMEILEATEDHWTHHPDGDDLAVCHIAGLSQQHFRFKFVQSDLFLTRDIITQYNIGPGDDTFLVGRFVNHEGGQRNLPSLRFGNIAMMPLEGIQHPTRGILQESFLVETRSIGGYSGSPVFVHIPPFASRPGPWPPEGHSRFGGGTPSSFGPWLLGIDWCHIPNIEKVRDRSDRELSEGWQVHTNTGMMGVIPAWILMDLLNVEELAMIRKQEDEKLAKQPPNAVLDDAAEFSREDFEDALRKVSRRIKPSESEPTSS